MTALKALQSFSQAESGMTVVIVVIIKHDIFIKDTIFNPKVIPRLLSKLLSKRRMSSKINYELCTFQRRAAESSL